MAPSTPAATLTAARLARGGMSEVWDLAVVRMAPTKAPLEPEAVTGARVQTGARVDRAQVSQLPLTAVANSSRCTAAPAAAAAVAMAYLAREAPEVGLFSSSPVAKSSSRVLLMSAVLPARLQLTQLAVVGAAGLAARFFWRHRRCAWRVLPAQTEAAGRAPPEAARVDRPALHRHREETAESPAMATASPERLACYAAAAAALGGSELTPPAGMRTTVVTCYRGFPLSLWWARCDAINTWIKLATSIAFGYHRVSMLGAVRQISRAIDFFDRPAPQKASEATEAAAFGHFHLQRKIGSGAMATVHLALDKLRQRPVALKLFERSPGQSRLAFRRQVALESAAMAAVRHPNVAAVYEHGRVEGDVFLAMQYVPGETLADIIDRGPVSSSWALSILMQVAAAVDAVHAAGFVHGDVKPNNILINEQGRLFLIDFGAATRRSVAEFRIRQGSPGYVAPEVISGAITADGERHRSDVYSLGICAFELLTARLPFAATGPDEMLQMHVGAEPARASKLRRAVPAAADGVLYRAIAKSPGERFDSAGAFVRELAGVLQD